MKKMVSWNVNGIRACINKGFAEAFESLDADIFCVQETKVQEGQVDFSPEGYNCYWNYAEKKGYSGVAIFTKEEPLSVKYGMDDAYYDNEGRVITLEFDNFYFIGCYTPNAQDGLRRLDYRMQWEDKFRSHLLLLNEKKPVIFCGDLNVAHEEIDLKNPKTNRGNPGFSDEERGKFSLLLESGFTDSFRYFYPDLENEYSWWSYRFHARDKNIGWRIDYFCVSDSIKEKLLSAKIHQEIFGSDHCPVEIMIDL
ncbi:MAG: exodeoxyribonuclease III [Clostridiales bacterium]|nr:exodeoxyribonuclease III [Clostridiales bacterium]